MNKVYPENAGRPSCKDKREDSRPQDEAIVTALVENVVACCDLGGCRVVVQLLPTGEWRPGVLKNTPVAASLVQRATIGQNEINQLYNDVHGCWIVAQKLSTYHINPFGASR